MPETPSDSSSKNTADTSADQQSAEAAGPQANAAATSSNAANTSKAAGWRATFRKYKWRITGGVTAAVVLVLLLVVALIPTMISGGLLRGTLLGIADDAVQGQITWDTLKLRWGSGQRIEGLKIADEQGVVIINVSKVDAPDVSLWSVMWGSRDLGTVSVVLDQADIVQQADGQYNLQKALMPKASADEDDPKDDDTQDKDETQTTELFGGLKVKLSFQGSDIRIKPLDAEAVTIQNVAITGDLSDPASDIFLNLESTFAQMNKPAGKVQSRVRIGQLVDAQGVFQFDKATIDAVLKVDRLTWSAVAAMAELNPSYAAIVGDDLTLGLELKGDLMAPSGGLQMVSSTMKGDLELVSSDAAFGVKPGASFVMNLDGNGWQAWAGQSGTQLQSPVKLLAEIQKLSLPRTPAGFDLAKLSASMDLSVSDVAIEGAEPLGRLSLTGTRGELRTDRLGQKVSLSFAASASRNEQAGQIQFNAVASDLADDNGELGLSRVNADVQAAATDLPVVVMDQLMGLGDLLANVLGSTLEAKLTANIRPSADGQAASGPFGLTLATSQFNASFTGRLTPDALLLDETSNAALELTPQGAAAVGFPKDSLVSPVLVLFEIQQAMIPRNEQGLRLQEGKLLTMLNVPLVALKPAGDLKRLNFENLNTTITSQAIGSMIEVKASAKANADDKQGTFTANATIANLFGSGVLGSVNAMAQSGESAQAVKPTAVRFEMAAKDVPVAAMEVLASQQNVLVPWLGDSLAMQGQGQLDDFTQGHVTFAMDTAQLRVETKASIDQGILHVDPQSSVRMTVASDGLEPQGITLSQPLVVTVTLGDISLPVVPLVLDRTQIKNLSIHTTPVQLAGDLVKTGYGISAFKGSLVSPRLAEGLTFDLQGKAERNGAADSPIVVHAQVDRPLDKNMRATANVMVSKVAVAVVDVIAKQDGLLLAILGPELEFVRLDAHAIPNQTTTGASLPAQALATEEPVSAPWQIEISARSTNLDVPGLKGQLVPKQQVELSTVSPIKMRVTKSAYKRLMRPAPEPAPVAAATNSAGAQAEVKKEGGAVSRLLGSVLAAATRKDSTLQPANVASKDEQAEDFYQLAQQLNVSVNIQSVALSLLPEPETADKATDSEAVPLDLKRVSLAASVELDELAFVHKDHGDRVAVKGVKANLAAPSSVGEALTVTVTGDTLAVPGKHRPTSAQTVAGDSSTGEVAQEIPSEDGSPVVDHDKPVQGDIDTKIILKNLAMLPEGGVDFYHMDSQWQVHVRKLPSPLLDSLAGQRGKLTGLLGGAADLTLTGDMPGNLDLELYAPLTRVDAKLVLTQDRVVKLREDVAVQLVSTPESVAMLGLLSPQLLALESTKRPMQLKVHQKDFSLPLPAPGEALDVTRIRGDLTLELGQVLLRKQGMVKTVYEVLGKFGGKFNTGEKMDVNFTPLKVSIANGHVKTNDMWLVSDELLMGTQAQIDMTQTPAFAHVFVAISGQTLMKMPGSRDNLRPNYVVEIQIASPLSEVKLNYADLVLQLSPLFVTTYTGKHGGDVLDILGGGIDRLKTLGKDNDNKLIRVTWPNHPKPVVVEGEADGAVSDETAKPDRETEAEVEAEEKSVVDSIFDLFKKKKKD